MGGVLENMCRIKLVSVKPSKAKHQKLTATFNCPIKKKYTEVHFGDRRYSDFTTDNKKYGTIIQNERKRLYLNRHRKDNYHNVCFFDKISVFFLSYIHLLSGCLQMPFFF